MLVMMQLKSKTQFPYKYMGPSLTMSWMSFQQISEEHNIVCHVQALFPTTTIVHKFKFNAL